MRAYISMIFLLGVGAVCFAQAYDYPYAPFNDRDSMRPLVNDRGQILIKEKTELGDFILQGIMYHPQEPRVIINNEILSEGEVFEGYLIKKIGAYKVILEKDGEEFILKWEG